MYLKQRRSHIPYTKEEKYSYFVERKCVMPLPSKNKRKYDKSKDRRNNKVQILY